MTEPKPHRCDEKCVCPIHGTPLIYWPMGEDHACQNVDCVHGHGMKTGASVSRVMEELAEWLLVQLRGERAEILNHWDSDGEARVATMWAGGNPGYTTVASDHRDYVWCADGHEVEDPRHVQVLFDPVRALAESEVKRQFVEAAREVAESYRRTGIPTSGYATLKWVLQTIAQLYSDRPGYRQEWRQL